MQTAASVFRFETADNRNAFFGQVHYHDTWEIYYLTGGRCHYFIGNRTYQLDTGDLVVIPPGVIHKVIYDSDTHSRMLINCSPDCVDPLCAPYLEQITHFSPDPTCARHVQSLFGKLQAEDRQRDAFFAQSCRGLLTQLLVLLCRNLSSPKISADSSFVEDAVLYIHENFSGHLTLTETARHCAVSPEHLSRVFRRETGFGFNEYVNIYRLKRAESILKNGSYQSIAQVAGLCGFPDSNYFSKAYRRMYGLPPSKVKPDAP